MAYKYKIENGKKVVIGVDKRAYPLRKVVERDVVGECNGIPDRLLSRLECGHLIPPAKDFYGDIHSDKQRCKLCHLQKQNP